MSIKTKKIRLSTRERRKIGIRKKIFGTAERPRLAVFRSTKHIYAQIISDETGKVLAAASTLDADVRDSIKSVNVDELSSKAKSTKSMAAAKAVGTALAKRGLENKLEKIVFDRSGYLYHGRIKALADGAREGGLQF